MACSAVLSFWPSDSVSGARAYEALWKLINRGETAKEAYELLKERVDDEILKAYPQFFGSAEVAGTAQNGNNHA